MSRYTRQAAWLAKPEVTYGTDSVPTGAANAILMSNPSFKLNNLTVDRDLIRPYFGASEQLSSTKTLEHGGDVELVGPGVAGDAPAWAPLLLACAFAETLTATIRADYVPVTDGQASVSDYCFNSGALHKALGTRGKVSIGMKVGEIPKLKFQMIGLYGGISAAVPSGVDFTGFQTPQVVTNTNTTKLYLGASLNLDALAPELTGGTQYPSMGIELDLGLEVPMTALVGGETVDVTGRKLTGKVTLDLTAAQEVTKEGEVLSNTLQSLAFLHGTVAGKKVLVYAPTMQLSNPTYTDLNGRQLVSYDLTGVPTTDGNDELRIVLF